VDDITEQLARRDSFRRKLALRMTPEQRMHEMAQRQRALEELLERSGEGYLHFLRRNFKARAIDVRELHDV
jgi:hypothetical protein